MLDKKSYSPQLLQLDEDKKRLIDNGMLHLEASLAGNAERYKRGETSHTIHVWWARRPHSAMRALSFASLSKNKSLSSIELLKQLSQSSDINLLEESEKELLEQYNGAPKMLDMFGGGGTIPLEGSNLGAKVYSIDSNQLSVFIQRANLVYSQDLHIDDAVSLVGASGKRVLNNLSKESGLLFPLRNKIDKTPIGYFWTYSYNCSNCNYKFYLSKRRWLSKKNNANLALIFENGQKQQHVNIGKVNSDSVFKTNWKGKSIICPSCNEKHDNISIQDCNDEMVAMVKPGAIKGKDYLLPSTEAIPSKRDLLELEEKLLYELKMELPSSTLPKWSGIVNPALYGIETHADFINHRQRLMLLLLIKSLRDEYIYLNSEHGENIANFVIAQLTSLIDQLVDWNCRLSMWISQNEQVGRAFSGPGVAMYWDYIEIDPVLKGPANLWSKLERIIKGIQSINKFKHKPNIQHAYAQDLPFSDDYFDAIVTDPPYYDNIYYSILADFFYAWKKPILDLIDPNLSKSATTDFSKELVASKHRNGSSEKAHEDYCQQFNLAINEASRVLKKDGVFSLVYSHSSINGWDVIVQSYRNSPFLISSVQPLSIERKQRPRAMTSKAVNTCVTFVARKLNKKKQTKPITDLLSEIDVIAKRFGVELLDLGWSEEDAGLAVFANGVALMANASEITGVKNDTEALILLGEKVTEHFPSYKVKVRKSL